MRGSNHFLVLLEMIKEFHGDKKITNKVARNYVSDGSIGLLEIGFPSASTTRITDLQKTYLNLYQKNLFIVSDKGIKNHQKDVHRKT